MNWRYTSEDKSNRGKIMLQLQHYFVFGVMLTPRPSIYCKEAWLLQNKNKRWYSWKSPCWTILYNTDIAWSKILQAKNDRQGCHMWSHCDQIIFSCFPVLRSYLSSALLWKLTLLKQRISTLTFLINFNPKSPSLYINQQWTRILACTYVWTLKFVNPL